MSTLTSLSRHAVVLGAITTFAVSQQVLTANYTLQDDIHYSGAGACLVIGAPGITVDLNGHSIISTNSGPLSSTVGIDNTGGHADVTITNGTIENFGWCIQALDADRMKLDNLELIASGWSFTGPNSASGAVGFEVENGVALEVSDVSVTNAVLGAWTVGESGMSMERVSATDCFIGIDPSSTVFGSSNSPAGTPGPGTTGVIAHCEATDCLVGLQIEDTDDLLVTECEFSRNGVYGISLGLHTVAPSNVRIRGCALNRNVFGILALSFPAGPGGPLELWDLEITENEAIDNVRGMALVNVQSSDIAENRLLRNDDFGMVLFEQSSGNTVRENTANLNGSWGIALIPILSNFSAPGPIGNLITGNTALRNGAFDLFHTASSSPNTWVENTFKTSSGVDID